MLFNLKTSNLAFEHMQVMVMLTIPIKLREKKRRGNTKLN